MDTHSLMEGEITSELVQYLKEKYGEVDVIENEDEEWVQISRPARLLLKSSQNFLMFQWKSFCKISTDYTDFHRLYEGFIRICPK